MFGIYHVYDMEGDFGEAIPEYELIAVCEDEDFANEWAKTFDRTHIYEKSTDDLQCGTLKVESMDRIIRLTEENRNVSPWSTCHNSFGWRGGIVESP